MRNAVIEMVYMKELYAYDVCVHISNSRVAGQMTLSFCVYIFSIDTWFQHISSFSIKHCIVYAENITYD